MGIDKNLSDAFGIEPTSASKEIQILDPNEIAEIEDFGGKPPSANARGTAVTTLTPTPPVSVDSEDDYELIRATLRNLISKGNNKLEEMGVIASTNEQARSFEVYSNMMEKISGLTKDLYDLHKKKKELATPDASKKIDETNITVDKAVFVGTTADLLKQMKEAKKKDGT